MVCGCPAHGEDDLGCRSCLALAGRKQTTSVATLKADHKANPMCNHKIVMEELPEVAALKLITSFRAGVVLQSVPAHIWSLPRS